MPEVTIPVMDEEEQRQFSQAAQVILLAQTDGLCSFKITEKPEGRHEVTGRVIQEGFHRREEIEAAIDTALTALAEGRAMVTTDRRGRRSLVPAEITRRHHYPVAHMTEQQEEEFQQDLRAVNEAMMRRDCIFESLLDDQAQVYFRYSIADGAENGGEILSSIHRIVDHVHAGRCPAGA